MFEEPTSAQTLRARLAASPNMQHLSPAELEAMAVEIERVDGLMRDRLAGYIGRELTPELQREVQAEMVDVLNGLAARAGKIVATADAVDPDIVHLTLSLPDAVPYSLGRCDALNTSTLCKAGANACPHIKQCANHDSAGDFRAEDGGAPLLYVDAGQLWCPKTFSNKVHGFVELKDGGFFVRGYLAPDPTPLYAEPTYTRAQILAEFKNFRDIMDKNLGTYVTKPEYGQDEVDEKLEIVRAFLDDLMPGHEIDEQEIRRAAT